MLHNKACKLKSEPSPKALNGSFHCEVGIELDVLTEQQEKVLLGMFWLR